MGTRKVEFLYVFGVYLDKSRTGLKNSCRLVSHSAVRDKSSPESAAFDPMWGQGGVWNDAEWPFPLGEIGSGD